MVFSLFGVAVIIELFCLPHLPCSAQILDIHDKRQPEKAPKDKLKKYVEIVI